MKGYLNLEIMINCIPARTIRIALIHYTLERNGKVDASIQIVLLFHFMINIYKRFNFVMKAILTFFHKLPKERKLNMRNTKGGLQNKLKRIIITK